MPAAIARPVWRPVAPGALTSAIDFSLAGDTLLVLDARSHRVVLLHWEGDAWRPLRTIGRRGGGPGEFLRPRSLALIGDSAFAVLEDDGRLQLFGRDGSHHLSEIPSLPCPMFAPTLAYGTDGRRFAAGNCAGPGAARDTVFTVLFAGPDPGVPPTPTVRRVSSDAGVASAGVASAGAADDSSWHELARVPRIALDLSWGSTFATLHPLSQHGDSIYFGTGVGGCLTRLAATADASPTAATGNCDLVAERFHAEPPVALLANQREARRRGDRKLERVLAWPDALPAFFGVVPAGDSLLLVRPVSADSLVVVPARRPFQLTGVRLVAPMSGFVTCNHGACLWYDAGRDAIALVRFDAAGAAVQGGGGPR
ncbi:MAG: hypothetical protein ACYC2G_08075 [Gemmatimonadaceae bacterium]